MTYTIKMKDHRPAGDWLIIAEDENGNSFHGNFATEPTDADVQKAVEDEAAMIKASEEIAAIEAAEEAERLAEEEAEGG
tara:strand:- start:400 stop:636 length:237 start_codon:yes stop_codon:yes gene_type:complete